MSRSLIRFLLIAVVCLGLFVAAPLTRNILVGHAVKPDS